MWRSLLKCFFPCKQRYNRPPTPYHPVVARSAPILSEPRGESSSNCARGYQCSSDNSRLPEVSPYGPLPACGYWTPSSSYISSSSNDLPWFVAGPAGLETLASHFSNDSDNSRQVDSVACPLKRGLAIGRREGECIRRRRRIHRDLSPEELVEGLGMMLVDRSTSIAFQVRIHAVRQTPTRIIVEYIDSDDDD